MSTATHVWKNGIRYHRTPIGDFPGVTSILSETKDAYSVKALEKWKKELGKEKAQAYKERAVKRGNSIHKAIELNLLRGASFLDSPIVDTEYQPLLKSLEPVLKDITTIRYIEQNTHHYLGYGGSPDLIADYKGRLTLIDWKTSTKPKKRSYIGDYILQVCAYISSANYCLNLNISHGLVVVCVEGLEEAQLFEISPSQYLKGWEKFKTRLNQFYDKYPSGDF